MMLLEPTQTKVAMTVLPRGGFWGLNSFPICVPLWGGRVPLNPHSAIVVAVASVASTGTTVGPAGSGGLAASVQAAASSAARSPVDLIWPPCRDTATVSAVPGGGKVRAALWVTNGATFGL